MMQFNLLKKIKINIKYWDNIMSSIPTATDAKTIGLASNTVTQEIFIIIMRIVAAAQAGALTTTSSATTQVTINSEPITGSIMTLADATGWAYYNAWQGTITDDPKVNQMQQVIDYFTNLGYTITRKSSTGTELYWSVSW